MTAVSAFDFISPELHENIADRTSNEDVTQQLQEWLDFCAENNRAGHLPAGLYNISAPLWVARTKQPNGFYTSYIQGDGGGYTDNISQSTINATHLDGPALIIQRARGVRLKDIMINGQNTATPGFPTFDQDDYLSPGVRVDRYSPHCGIAIDPTLGSPRPVEQRYPALVDDYLGDIGGCKNIWIDGVSVRNFVVGIVVSPAQSFQAEMTTIENCHVGDCDIGISFGQPQSRASSVRNCDIEFCRIGFSLVDHGFQTGALQLVDTCQFVHVSLAFRYVTNKGVNNVSNCYFEVVRKLLEYGGGFSQIKAPMIFDKCEYRFVKDFGITNKYYDPMIASGNSPVVFNQCWFVDNGLSARTMNFAATHNFAHFKFNDCHFWAEWPTNPQSAISVQRGNTFTTPQNGLGLFKNCWVMSNNDNVVYRIEDATAESGEVAVKIQGAYSFSGDDLLFTCLSQAEADKLSVDQLIYWELGVSPHIAAIPGMYVASIDGLDVIARLMFNPDYYDPSPLWLQAGQIKAVTFTRTDNG